MTTWRGVPKILILLSIALLGSLGACSGSQPGSPGAPSALPAAPTAFSPAPTQAGSATPTAPNLSKWEAFLQKSREYAKIVADVRSMTSLWAAGDIAAAKESAARLRSTSVEMTAWLDANTPDECYRPSWTPLREAADLIAAGAAGYLADDIATGAAKLSAGGYKLLEAGGTIMVSGDRCQAAGG
jgi:hypothetical protein